jgi:hypothetical protein
VDRASRKSNPSFDWYQKTRKPEVLENQKTRSTRKPENQKTKKTRKPEPVLEVPVQIFAGQVLRGKT